MKFYFHSRVQCIPSGRQCTVRSRCGQCQAFSHFSTRHIAKIYDLALPRFGISPEATTAVNGLDAHTTKSPTRETTAHHVYVILSSILDVGCVVPASAPSAAQRPHDSIHQSHRNLARASTDIGQLSSAARSRTSNSFCVSSTRMSTANRRSCTP
jgi:hypothetical protein